MGLCCEFKWLFTFCLEISNYYGLIDFLGIRYPRDNLMEIFFGGNLITATNLGICSEQICCLTRIGIPMIKIRRPYDHIIFLMSIRYLILQLGPSSVFYSWMNHFVMLPINMYYETYPWYAYRHFVSLNWVAIQLFWADKYKYCDLKLCYIFLEWRSIMAVLKIDYHKETM